MFVSHLPSTLRLVTYNLLLQSMMSTINPFIGNSTITKTTTPVISWKMNRCDDSKRRKRRSETPVGLTEGSHTLVNINIPQTTFGLWVNATPTAANDGIAMSQFNLTSPGRVPLVIRATPSQPSSVKVFVRRNSLPTTKDYDWLLENADNYTLYLTADQTKDVAHIYLGVQSSSGMSSPMLFLLHCAAVLQLIRSFTEISANCLRFSMYTNLIQFGVLSSAMVRILSLWLRGCGFNRSATAVSLYLTTLAGFFTQIYVSVIKQDNVVLMKAGKSTCTLCDVLALCL